MVEQRSDLDLIAPAARETESRPLRKSSVDVVEYRPDPEDGAYYLAPPGSLTAFIARKGSWVLEEVRSAASAGDGEDSRLFERLSRFFDGRTRMPLADAVAMVIDQPTYASLRYAGKMVATNLFLPDGIPVVSLALPFNGGRLAEDAFELVEHFREGSEIELEAVILKHAPPLTEAEQEAMRQVPPDQEELNVGPIGMCYALSAVAVAALVCLATTLCCRRRHWDRWREEVNPRVDPRKENLTSAEVQALGPAATAREILRRRRAWLEESRD